MISLYVKCRLFWSDLKENLIFRTDFRKKIHITIFMKILSVGAEFSMRMDRQTDRKTEGGIDKLRGMKKLTVIFRYFCESAQKP
jgi:hypothetical protein